MVRNVVSEAIPEAEERISWSMPTFWKKHNIIQFAGFKNHIGLYPGPEALEEFGGRLKGYKTSKGTIQIPYGEDIPLELIRDIARWCYETGNHPRYLQRNGDQNEETYPVFCIRTYHLLLGDA